MRMRPTADFTSERRSRQRTAACSWERTWRALPTASPSAPSGWRWGLGVLGALVALACTEDLTAPGKCPNFCPTTKIQQTDTIIAGMIGRDSSYGRPIGYVSPQGAGVLLADSLPTLDSRPIIRFGPVATRALIASTDTTTGPLMGP